MSLLRRRKPDLVDLSALQGQLDDERATTDLLRAVNADLLEQVYRLSAARDHYRARARTLTIEVVELKHEHRTAGGVPVSPRENPVDRPDVRPESTEERAS